MFIEEGWGLSAHRTAAQFPGEQLILYRFGSAIRKFMIRGFGISPCKHRLPQREVCEDNVPVTV